MVIISGVPIFRIFTVVKFCYYTGFQNNPKDLAPSYNMNLDLWDWFGSRLKDGSGSLGWSGREKWKIRIISKI